MKAALEAFMSMGIRMVAKKVSPETFTKILNLLRDSSALQKQTLSNDTVVVSSYSQAW